MKVEEQNRWQRPYYFLIFVLTLAVWGASYYVDTIITIALVVLGIGIGIISFRMFQKKSE